MSHANLEMSMVQIFFTGSKRWQRAIEFRFFVMADVSLSRYMDEDQYDPKFVQYIEDEVARRNQMGILRWDPPSWMNNNFSMVCDMNNNIHGRVALGKIDDVIYAGNFPNAIVVEVLGQMYGKADGWDMRLYPKEVELWYAEK